MMIKAVLFDFDGVIAQTETYKLKQLMLMLDHFQVAYTKEQIFSMAGTIGSEVLKKMQKLFYQDAAFIAHQDEILAFKTTRPDLKALKTKNLDELLTVLKNRYLKLAVASNSSAARLQMALDSLSIASAFDLIASATDLGRLKPDPYVYQYAMAVFNVRPEETLIIEDSQLGIAAGKKAGAYVAALKDELGAIDQRGAYIILEDIGKVVEFIDFINLP